LSTVVCVEPGGRTNITTTGYAAPSHFRGAGDRRSDWSRVPTSSTWDPGITWALRTTSEPHTLRSRAISPAGVACVLDAESAPDASARTAAPTSAFNPSLVYVDALTRSM
jgi:hypothetical protein